MSLSISSQSHLTIVNIKKNTFVDFECSICYKSITTKSFVQCSAPCEKVFHTVCIEKMIDQTEATCYEDDTEPQHKCCYCRRSINLYAYGLQISARQLFCLSHGGYNVNEAMDQLHQEIKKISNGEEEAVNDDLSFSVYELRNLHDERKPKQNNRMASKKINKQRRIHFKQNIGGRRRS